MTTNSADTLDRTTQPTPLYGERKPWRTWQDWVNIALGVYLVFAPIWTATAPTGWFITVGLLAIAAGLWATGTGSSSAAEWSQILIGIVLFLSPWFGGFAAATAGALTAWVIGAALAVLAGVAMHQNRRDTTNARAHA